MAGNTAGLLHRIRVFDSCAESAYRIYAMKHWRPGGAFKDCRHIERNMVEKYADIIFAAEKNNISTAFYRMFCTYTENLRLIE